MSASRRFYGDRAYKAGRNQRRILVEESVGGESHSLPAVGLLVPDKTVVPWIHHGYLKRVFAFLHGIRDVGPVRKLPQGPAFLPVDLHDGDDNLFYEEIYKALWGGIADKFNIQQSLLSSDTIRRHLEEKAVDQTLQQQILKTLEDVDFARFAPGDSSAKKQSIYNEAMDTITNIAAIKNK